MASYDEEIRVAIIATADGVQAGTHEAASAIEDFNTRVTAAQTQAAAAYNASQRAWADAQARVAQVLADTQSASVAQITEAYDALNAARDANLANAQAYLTELSAAQREALGAEDYAAQAAAASLSEQVMAERAAAEAAYEASAAQLEVAGAIDASTAATEADTAAQVEDAAAKVGNTGATIGLTEAVAGLARGNVGMAAYGMARMGAAGQLMQAVMSPLGLTIAGVTAAVVGLGIAMVEGADQQAELRDALLSTGYAAGVTVGQIEALSQAMATGDVTVGDARQALLSLAQSGQVSGNEYRIAAQAALDFASVTGEKVPQAAQMVLRVMDATIPELVKLNGQYHFLTAAEMDQIAALTKQGDVLQANDLKLHLFAQAQANAAAAAQKSAGDIMRAWEAVKREFSSLGEGLLSIGAKVSPQQHIKALEEQLASMKRLHAEFGILYNPTGAEANIERQIAALKKLEAQENATAQAAAKNDAAQQAAIEKKYGPGVSHALGHSAAVGGFTMPAESASGASAEIAQDARILDALQRQAERREQIAAQVNATNEGAARSHAQAMLQIHLDQLRTEEAEGKITHAQELADEQKLYADEYAAQLAAYQRQLALEQGKPAVVARINAEIEALQDAHLQRMTAAQETAAQRQAQAFQRALQPITSAFTTSINGIIMGTQTMQMAVGRILDSILLKYLDVAIKSSVQWVASEAQKTMATEMGTVERVALVEIAEARTLAIKMLNAAKYFAIAGAEAAVGAFKAMVGIPYIGPVLAVAAAAGAAAEVKNLAHFDVGAWNIPHDMPAMVHAGETILPRPFAEDFRRNGGNLGGTPGGDVHVHLHGQSAGGLFTAHIDDLVQAFKIAHRTGAFA